MENIVQLFTQGGPVMVVILVCSIAALAVFLERLVYLRQSYHLPPRLVERLQHLKEGQMVQIVDELRTSHRPFHRVVLKVLEHRGKGTEEIAQRIAPSLSQAEKELTRGLDVLSTITTVAPLLGLLGTVLGMFTIFQTVSGKGIAEHSHLLAQGIAEAILTTIFGLCVAIPTFVAYKYLKGRADRMMGHMENHLNGVLEKFHHPQKSV